MSDRETVVTRHAVTHEMTKNGPRIVRDQVVTAESDTRPPEARPAPKQDAAEHERREHAREEREDGLRRPVRHEEHAARPAAPPHAKKED